MDNNLFISNFKKWPLAAILALGLLLITEGVARHNAEAIRSFSDKLILYKKNIIESKKTGPFRGVILGDSLALGVDAKLLSRTISRQLNQDFPVYNLSLPEHGVQGYYLLLKKYLRHRPPPEVIFFSVSPSSWSGQNNFVRENEMMSTGLHRFCLLFSVPDCVEVFPAYFFPKALIGKIERLSFLVTYRRMIRDFLERAADSPRPEPSLADLTVGRNGGVNFGIGEPPSDNAIKSTANHPAPFMPDAEALFWYEKFFHLAQKKDIRVIIFNAPVIEEVCAAWRDNGDNERYRGLMNDLAQKFPVINTVDPLWRPYNRTLFRDIVHLNGPGYDQFSRGLANQLSPLTFKLIKGIDKE